MLEHIAKSAPVIFYTKDNHTIELILLKYESASIQDLSFLLRIKTHEDVLVRMRRIEICTKANWNLVETL